MRRAGCPSSVALYLNDIRRFRSSRLGLRGEPRTLQQVGEAMGPSRERIRQIERTAVGRLCRRLLGERGRARQAACA